MSTKYLTKQQVSIITNRIGAWYEYQRYLLGLNPIEDIMEELMDGDAEYFEGVPQEYIREVISRSFEGGHVNTIKELTMGSPYHVKE